VKIDPLVCQRVIQGISAELFHSDQKEVTCSPSVHDKSGKLYHWEVFGEVPVWSWKDLNGTIGEFQTKKEVKRETRDKAPKANLSQFKGDLTTLDIVALVKEAEIYNGPTANGWH
jgi:hypothetical protein